MNEKLRAGVNEVIARRANAKHIPIDRLGRSVHVSHERIQRSLRGRGAFFETLRTPEIFGIFEALDIPLDEAVHLLKQGPRTRFWFIK